jgi:hypothetical protein
LERAKGIEPSYAAWEAAVLPLNYARNRHFLIIWLRFGSAFSHECRRARKSEAAHGLGTRAVAVERGMLNRSTTSREPHIGQRKRVSKRESGKPLPRVHTNVSISSSAR